MVSLDVAEKGRVEWSEYLRKRGAFAIAVQQSPLPGREDFVLEAWFVSAPEIEFPRFLGVRTGTGFVQLPLMIRIDVPPFSPD
jgi:hypothetical protein